MRRETGGRSRFARAWVFDLDNTLHDANPHIFPHISRSMTAYLQAHLDLEVEAASALRVAYWKRYGATLLGLMRHHATDPRHFLWHTHQFPELRRMVVREPWLKQALARLPGRKFLFSNSPVHYSRAVLAVLGISGLFDDVFSIEHTRFRPKPDLWLPAPVPPPPAASRGVHHGRGQPGEPAGGEVPGNDDRVGESRPSHRVTWMTVGSVTELPGRLARLHQRGRRQHDRENR